MKVPVPTLNPVLRSDTQGRILARIFADPETGHSLTALMEHSNASMPTVIREVRRAEQAGLVETWKEGNVRRGTGADASPAVRCDEPDRLGDVWPAHRGRRGVR